MDCTSQFMFYFSPIFFHFCLPKWLLRNDFVFYQMFFPKLYPILLYFYIATGFSIQLMEFARVASYQNLSFCWTVPLFLNISSDWLSRHHSDDSYRRNSFKNFCSCVLCSFVVFNITWQFAYVNTYFQNILIYF